MKGQTASAGFQIGVRRTYPISQEQAWALLMSPEGLKLWLGDLPSLELQVKHKYAAADGVCGELRVVKPYHQLRMTWQPKGWEKPSTLQIRLLAHPKDANKTTISFHQEKLEDALARERMKLRWEEVSVRIMELVHALSSESEGREFKLT